MNCEQFQARYLAGEPVDSPSGHLASCPACRSAVPGLDQLRSQLSDTRLWEDPPPELRSRVTAAVLAEADPPVQTRFRARWLVAALAALVLMVGLVAAWSMWSARPDWTVDLVAVGDGGGASVAGWNTATGTRMNLHVSGLDPVDDAYYEVWLTSPDGRHVSAGTFRDSGTVTVWAGVRRAEFPRIWITLEEVGANRGPSGVVVFDTEAYARR